MSYGAGPQTSNFPNGFAFGITVRGLPLLQSHPGSVFWVDNSATAKPFCTGGADGNPGTFTRPLATIAKAVSKCTAGAGDIIMVKPGHAESIADATTLSLNVAGVAIIGLGAGANRPTLTFTTATTANIPVTAANVSIQNFLFKCNFAAVASVFTATGTATPTDFAVENCTFYDIDSTHNFVSVVTGNATANSLDGLRFAGNRIHSKGTTAATTAIKFAAAAERIDLLDNFGVWAVLNDTACFVAAGANNLTSFNMGRNRLYKPNTSSTGGSFVSGSGNAWTGHAYDNYMYQLDNSAGIWIPTGTGIGFSQNFSPITGAADKSGLINPAAV